MPITRVSKDFKKLLKDSKDYFKTEEGIKVTEPTITQIIAKKIRPKDLNVFNGLKETKKKNRNIKETKRRGLKLSKMFK